MQGIPFQCASFLRKIKRGILLGDRTENLLTPKRCPTTHSTCPWTRGSLRSLPTWRVTPYSGVSAATNQLQIEVITEVDRQKSSPNMHPDLVFVKDERLSKTQLCVPCIGMKGQNSGLSARLLSQRSCWQKQCAQYTHTHSIHGYDFLRS